MEILDIVDENGEPTGETVQRDTAHSNGILHRTAHVWLFRNADGRLQVLLQKRSIHKQSWPGCWDISSAGHIPAGQGFTESALRELHEELGIDAQPQQLIQIGRRRFFTRTSFDGKPFIDNQITNVYVISCSTDAEKMNIQHSELDDVRWFDWNELLNATKSDTLNHCLADEELQMLQKNIKKIV